jgi:hypothetical protein
VATDPFQRTADVVEQPRDAEHVTDLAEHGFHLPSGAGCEPS